MDQEADPDTLVAFHCTHLTFRKLRSVALADAA
jgi:hypothetical protein